MQGKSQGFCSVASHKAAYGGLCKTGHESSWALWGISSPVSFAPGSGHRLPKFIHEQILFINTMFQWKLMPTPETAKPGTTTGLKDHVNHTCINRESSQSANSTCHLCIYWSNVTEESRCFQCFSYFCTHLDCELQHYHKHRNSFTYAYEMRLMSLT